MDPLIIISTVKAVADATAEIFKFLQTPQGQRSIEKSMADRIAFEAYIRDVGKWFEKLFKGAL